MKSTPSLTVILAIVLVLVPATSPAADPPSLPPERVAAYIYAVIESHCDFYTTHVVERLEQEGAVKADGEWRTQKKTIPLPVQFVTETSSRFSSKFAGLRYRLISLWPINPLSSNSKCNTASPNGLRCCHAHTIVPAVDCGRT